MVFKYVFGILIFQLPKPGASHSHFWPSQRMAQPKFKKNWLGQIFGWAIIGPGKLKKNLAGPTMAGPLLAQPK